jgi:hypothetical protein
VKEKRNTCRILRRHLKKKKLERPWYRRHENITLKKCLVVTK